MNSFTKEEEDSRGLPLAKEDAGEGELQRGWHHLLWQGLKLEFDICLCGHGTGILLHVYTAGGQSLPPAWWRLLQRKRRGSRWLQAPIMLGWKKWRSRDERQERHLYIFCVCHCDFSCEILPDVFNQKAPAKAILFAVLLFQRCALGQGLAVKLEFGNMTQTSW